MQHKKSDISFQVFLICFLIFSTSSSFGQEEAKRRMYLNFYGGMGLFQSEVTNIGSSNFVPQSFQTLAPTGFGLSIGFLNKTYLDIEYSIQSLENENSYVVGESFGSGAGGGIIIARNNSFKLKQEIPLYKGLKISPFIGFSFLHLNQPSGFKTDLQIHSKSVITSSTNGVETGTVRDSVYHSIDYLTNSVTGVNIGIELKYTFNKKFSCYFTYTYLHSKKYYSHLYAEFYRTDIDPQYANIYFNASGHLLQLGVSWHLFNLEKVN